MKSYLTVLKKFSDIEGKANRSEYWYFIIFFIIGTIVCMVIDISLINYHNLNNIGHRRIEGLGTFTIIFLIVHIVPSISVSIRRLHDTDKSGWWYFIQIVPVLGQFVFFNVYDRKQYSYSSIQK